MSNLEKKVLAAIKKIEDRITLFGHSVRAASGNDCWWEFDSISYDTACGNGFFFASDDGLTENEFSFCPFCGKPIRSPELGDEKPE